MELLKTYSLYWSGGSWEQVRGNGPADAMNRAGIGHGALKALDFYKEEPERSCYYCEKTKSWETII